MTVAESTVLQTSREEEDNDCYPENTHTYAALFVLSCLYVHIPQLQSMSCGLLSCLLVGGLFPFT